MKTLNYAFNVWATTLLVSPLILSFFFIVDSNWADRIEFFFLAYIVSFAVSCFCSFVSVCIFLLLAEYLSFRDGDIYYKKMLLIVATLLGFIPAWIYMDYAMECFVIVSPWILIGVLSTFLYNWQPEND